MARQRLKDTALFLGGMVTMGAIILIMVSGPKGASADEYIGAESLFSIDDFYAYDQYSCIRTDLDAQGMTGNIPDYEFTITYDVPTCYANAGYAVQMVYMYGDQVAVHYVRTRVDP